MFGSSRRLPTEMASPREKWGLWTPCWLLRGRSGPSSRGTEPGRGHWGHPYNFWRGQAAAVKRSGVSRCRFPGPEGDGHDLVKVLGRVAVQPTKAVICDGGPVLPTGHEVVDDGHRLLSRLGDDSSLPVKGSVCSLAQECSAAPAARKYADALSSPNSPQQPRLVCILVHRCLHRVEDSRSLDSGI